MKKFQTLSKYTFYFDCWSFGMLECGMKAPKPLKLTPNLWKWAPTPLHLHPYKAILAWAGPLHGYIVLCIIDSNELYLGKCTYGFIYIFEIFGCVGWNWSPEAVTTCIFIRKQRPSSINTFSTFLTKKNSNDTIFQKTFQVLYLKFNSSWITNILCITI